MKLESKFDLYDRVHIDSDKSISATVTGYAFYGHLLQVEISWVHNGDLKSAWVIETRLSPVEPVGWPRQ